MHDEGYGEVECAAAWEGAKSSGVRGNVSVGWLNTLDNEKGSVAWLNKPYPLTPQVEGVLAR